MHACFYSPMDTCFLFVAFILSFVLAPVVNCLDFISALNLALLFSSFRSFILARVSELERKRGRESSKSPLRLQIWIGTFLFLVGLEKNRTNTTPPPVCPFVTSFSIIVLILFTLSRLCPYLSLFLLSPLFSSLLFSIMPLFFCTFLH
ncbi:MAG: hypothetical protein JOS17DRAFT_391932 [Linnemannia elongata]|nr:MAG: hypothetical protein JOS17DRAFT_391932 [Linnemannia elongata]